MDIDTRITRFELSPIAGYALRRIEAALAAPAPGYATETLPADITTNEAERLAEAVHMVAGRTVQLHPLAVGGFHLFTCDPRYTVRMRPGVYSRLLSLGSKDQHARAISHALTARQAAEQAAAEAFVAAMRAAAGLTE